VESLEPFRSQIEAALVFAGGTHTFEDVCALVASNKLQFWPGEQSAVVTEILQYPQLQALNFFLAGGNLTEIEAMTPIILQWGKAQGCTLATFTGRRGWSRTFLTRTGWKKSELEVLEKSLDG
jgi:hypothetical protein